MGNEVPSQSAKYLSVFGFQRGFHNTTIPTQHVSFRCAFRLSGVTSTARPRRGAPRR